MTVPLINHSDRLVSHSSSLYCTCTYKSAETSKLYMYIYTLIVYFKVHEETQGIDAGRCSKMFHSFQRMSYLKQFSLKPILSLENILQILLNLFYFIVNMFNTNTLVILCAYEFTLCASSNYNHVSHFIYVIEHRCLRQTSNSTL